MDPKFPNAQFPGPPPGYMPPPGYAPPPMYMAPPPPRGGFGCTGIWALVATIGFIGSFCLMCMVAASKTDGQNMGPSSLFEKTLEGEGEHKIVVIGVEGIIVDRQAGGIFGAVGESLVKRVKDQLERAKTDENVKAVVLLVDSPGGTVSASDEIYHHLMKFRADSKKPVVVHQGSLAASGGYYISAAGDEILCETTTITGSIGVIMQGMNLHEFLKSHGVQDMTVTSGPNKDLGSSTAPIREAHKEILQGMVDDMYGRFCDVVAEGIARRTGKKVEDVMADVKKLADGRIYTAKQAKDLKLVDDIVYREDAFEHAKKRAGVATARFVTYVRTPTLMDALSGNVEGRFSTGVTIKLDASALDELRTPRLLMLWEGK